MNFIKEYDLIEEQKCKDIIESLSFLFSTEEKIDTKYSSHAEVFITQYASIGKYIDLSELVRMVDKTLFNDYYNIDYIKDNTRNQSFCEATLFRMKKGEFIDLHTDNEYNPYSNKRTNVAILLYLNNPSGGELCFPVQKVVVKPKAGKLVIFPTFFTHPHMVMPVTDGERYLLRFNYHINEVP